MSESKIVRDVFFNPDEVGSFSSLHGFLQNNKVKNLRNLSDELHKLETYVLFQPVRKKYPTRKYLVYKYGHIWNIDLLDLSRFSRHKGNKGHRFCLTVVEALSRKAYAVGLRNKRANVVKEGFEKIIKEAGYAPKLIHADRGNEWEGSFRKYLDSLGTKMYHTFTDKKAVLVERFQKTLRSKLYKVMHSNGNKDWLSHLDSVINSYNKTKHGAHGMIPDNIDKNNEDLVIHRLYKSYATMKKNQKPPKFAVNDFVKLSRTKVLFEKSATNNYSLETFKIAKILPTVPWTYRLVDKEDNEVAGAYYQEQLIKVIPPLVGKHG